MGRKAPIAFVSWTVSMRELNHAQLDRETLVVFATQHFHKFIPGVKDTSYTDHQPLIGILGSMKPVTPVLSFRMERCGVRVSAYDFDLKYRPGRLRKTQRPSPGLVSRTRSRNPLRQGLYFCSTLFWYLHSPRPL